MFLKIQAACLRARGRGPVRAETPRRIRDENRQGFELVGSVGSAWGLIKPDDGEDEMFFSPQALVDPSEYAEIVLGQGVQFDEEPDRTNSTLAVRIEILPSEVEDGLREKR